MTGARLVHDTLEQQGWSVEIADAQKAKGGRSQLQLSGPTVPRKPLVPYRDA
jgi:hypothetical protein